MQTHEQPQFDDVKVKELFYKFCAKLGLSVQDVLKILLSDEEYNTSEDEGDLSDPQTVLAGKDILSWLQEDESGYNVSQLVDEGRQQVLDERKQARIEALAEI